MDAVTGVRGWIRTHPRLADLVPALLSVASALSVREPRDRLLDVPLVTASPVAVVCVLLAGALLVVRRDRPLAVWVVTTALGMVASGLIGGTAQALFPALVAVYTVATRCSFRTVTAVTVLTVVGPPLSTLAMGDGGTVEVLFALVAWVSAATAAGLAVRNQRAVVGAARQRAVDAERTADEHAQRRVAEERLRIARELHDVVAHHVAVITVQAGVARHLLPTDPAAATEALDHVRDASQLILQEIPALLGLLRTDEDDSPTAPAPRLAELPELVEAARHAGLTVRSRQTGVPIALDAVTDLTAYRVVQEALTNAVKHGDGAAEVSLRHHAGGVVVEVRNPLADPAPGRAGGRTGGRTVAGVSAPGHGLIGMRERLTAVGGELQVGPVGGEWVVRATLGARAAAPDEVALA